MVDGLADGPAGKVADSAGDVNKRVEDVQETVIDRAVTQGVERGCARGGGSARPDGSVGVRGSGWGGSGEAIAAAAVGATPAAAAPVIFAAPTPAAAQSAAGEPPPPAGSGGGSGSTSDPCADIEDCNGAELAARMTVCICRHHPAMRGAVAAALAAATAAHGLDGMVLVLAREPGATDRLVGYLLNPAAGSQAGPILSQCGPREAAAGFVDRARRLAVKKWDGEA